MGTYNNNIEDFYSAPNFENILSLVKRSYGELRDKNRNLKGKPLRDAFSEMLENLYQKYSSFDSFKGVFDSLEDFKSKISKSLNKGKNKLSRGNKIYLYSKDLSDRADEEERILKLLNREEY